MSADPEFMRREEPSASATWTAVVFVAMAGVAGGYLAVAAAGGLTTWASALWPLFPVWVLIGEALRARAQRRKEQRAQFEHE